MAIQNFCSNDLSVLLCGYNYGRGVIIVFLVCMIWDCFWHVYCLSVCTVLCTGLFLFLILECYDIVSYFCYMMTFDKRSSYFIYVAHKYGKISIYTYSKCIYTALSKTELEKSHPYACRLLWFQESKIQCSQKQPKILNVRQFASNPSSEKDIVNNQYFLCPKKKKK